MTTPATRSARRCTLTVPEVAALFGVAAWTVYGSVRSGAFPVPTICVGRRVLFATAAVERALGLEPGTLSGAGGVTALREVAP
ncbi:MAG: helix-turn-helix domain-containing protein [Acidimicrobiales bacterium]